MKVTKISESGMIEQDGRLRLPMDRINAFCAENKGKRVIVRFETGESGSSQLQLAYYYNYVVPTVSAALYEQGTRMRETAVDRWLVEQYPGEKDERITCLGMVEQARQFDKTQMMEFLEWLKQWAAENLYIYIDDPKTI